MPPPSPLPLDGLALTITAHPLTADAFASFGQVVQNPRPDVHPSRFADAGPPPLPFHAVSANQRSAIKYQHVTRLEDHYHDHAPSGVPAVAVINMFVCAARKLSPCPSATANSAGDHAGSRSGNLSAPSSAPTAGYFEVNILERHPFTTQTFSPLSTTSRTGEGKGGVSDKRKNAYLVIVAPNQPAPSPARIPNGGGTAPENPPDLTNLQAFVATMDQAVTYGAGTWHAPMVALGPEDSTVDFVVTQFANGVGHEDCQEVTFGKGAWDDGAIHVRVPTSIEKPVTSRL